MVEISDSDFEVLLGEALDSLPEKYVSKLLQEVAVTWEEEPSLEQRQQLKLRHNQTLYGLYEGLPLPQRYSGYGKITPDKITIFKAPVCQATDTIPALREELRHTLWHEMAHFFGLDHPRIHELE